MPESNLLNELVIDTLSIQKEIVENVADVVSFIDDSSKTMDFAVPSEVEIQDILKNETSEPVITEYIVRSGESLYGIARSQLGSPKKWSLIYEWNKETMGSDSTEIFPYQILEIRSELANKEDPKIENSIYLVQQGETLWEIASKAYNDPYAWKLIVHDNKNSFDDPNKILINQKLIIRSGI